MNSTANGTHPPPGVGRVLILGFYDGATNGVLEFDGHTYLFAMTDDEPNPTENNQRTYNLQPLPAGTLDRLAAVIGPYHAPQWPVWCPVWTFPTADIKSAVDREVDAVQALAGPPAGVITTDDPFRFTTLTARPFTAPITT